MPVVYEPAKHYAQQPIEPQRSDYERPKTTYVPPKEYSGTATLSRRWLPDLIMPLPESPDGGTYESVITSFMVAASTEQVRAWNWVSAESALEIRQLIRDLAWADLGESGSCGSIVQERPDPHFIDDGEQETPEMVDVVTADADCAIDFIEHSWGWYVDPQIVKKHGDSRLIAVTATLVQHTTTDDFSQIPRFTCTRRNRTGSCELHPDDTEEGLVASGLAEDRAKLMYQFVENYTKEETIDVIDWDRYKDLRRQYEEDLAFLIDHNDQVLANSYVTEMVCDGTCQSQYSEAVVRYKSALESFTGGVVLNQWEVDDYKYEKSKITGMFVDCKLSGCVLVNKVR